MPSVVEIGAMIEPLAVSWRAVKRADVKPGGSVLVLGAGPVRVVGSLINES